MAEQVAIPAGVNPANAIPDDAQVIQRGSGQPKLPSSAEQQPGWVAKPAGVVAPDGVDQAEYQAFLAFKAAQAKAAPVDPAVAAAAAAAEAKPVPKAQPMDPMAALDLVKSAGSSDPYIGSILGVFQASAPEVDLHRAIGLALSRGDDSLIDRAYLKEVAGDKAEQLANIAKGLVAHVEKEVRESEAHVFGLAGGESQWLAAAAVFNKGAPSHVKQFVAYSLNSGDKAAIKAAAATVVEFAKASGQVIVQPAGHVTPSGSGAPTGQGLSKAEFQKLHFALDKNDRDYANKSQELTARRQIGKNLGLQ